MRTVTPRGARHFFPLYPSTPPTAAGYVLGYDMSRLRRLIFAATTPPAKMKLRETLIKSMPRASAAKAGFILLDFADRLKAVPFKAMLNQSFASTHTDSKAQCFHRRGRG